MSYRTAARYYRSAGELDSHVDDCPSCSTGTACAAGDETAEGEYRAFRALQRDDPDAARAAQRDRPSR